MNKAKYINFIKATNGVTFNGVKTNRKEGRLIKLKNIERLISAFSRLSNKSVRLLIYGKGPEKRFLQNKISKAKLDNRIKLMGNVSHGELLQAIQNSWFVVLPSITEISPNLALECLSMAKPIIWLRNWLNVV